MSADVLHFPFMTSPPNRIHEFRKARGLSQQALADKLGCSKMLISSMERGQHQLTLHWLQRIAKLFGVPTADLLNEEDNPLTASDEERELLERYRAADPDVRRQIEKVTEALSPFHHQRDAA